MNGEAGKTEASKEAPFFSLVRLGGLWLWASSKAKSLEWGVVLPLLLNKSFVRASACGVQGDK